MFVLINTCALIGLQLEYMYNCQSESSSSEESRSNMFSSDSESSGVLLTM